MTDKEKAREIKEAKHHWRSGIKTVPYLGSHDLNEYKPIQLVISYVTKEITKGLKENQIMNIAHFTDKKYKSMLLNATNAKMLRAISGSPFIEDWKNIKVEIKVEQNVRAFGESFDALRIVNKKLTTSKIVITKDHPKYEEIKGKLESGTSRSVVEKYYDLSKSEL